MMKTYIASPRLLNTRRFIVASFYGLGLLGISAGFGQDAADDTPIAHQLTTARVPDAIHITNRASIQLPGPATGRSLNSRHLIQKHLALQVLPAVRLFGIP